MIKMFTENTKYRYRQLPLAKKRLKHLCTNQSLNEMLTKSFLDGQKFYPGLKRNTSRQKNIQESVSNGNFILSNQLLVNRIYTNRSFHQTKFVTKLISVLLKQFQLDKCDKTNFRLTDIIRKQFSAHKNYTKNPNKTPKNPQTTAHSGQKCIKKITPQKCFSSVSYK